MSCSPLPPCPLCPGIVRWRTAVAARTAKILLMRACKGRFAPHKDRRRKIGLLQPYECDRCGKWHLGHPIADWKGPKQ
jgi:hypothetical protein